MTEMNDQNPTTDCPNIRNDDQLIEEQTKREVLLKSNRVDDVVKTTADKETLKRMLSSAHMRD